MWSHNYQQGFTGLCKVNTISSLMVRGCYSEWEPTLKCGQDHSEDLLSTWWTWTHSCALTPLRYVVFRSLHPRSSVLFPPTQKGGGRANWVRFLSIYSMSDNLFSGLQWVFFSMQRWILLPK